MSRVRTYLLPFAAAFAFAAFAGAADDKGKHAEHSGKYEAHFHDKDGHHVKKKFDTSRAEDKAELAELIAHGHVTDLHNESAPTIPFMASIRADLAVWSLVIFGGLLFILSRYAWPKMLAGLHKRESSIHEALEAANRARAEADQMRASFKAESDKAQAEVRGLLEEARRDAAALREQEIVKTKAEIAAERERAHREIEIETDQALQKIWTRAADLATQVSSMALRKHLDESAHRRLIDEALGELKASSN